jgi:hypothetical protein
LAGGSNEEIAIYGKPDCLIALGKASGTDLIALGLFKSGAASTFSRWEGEKKQRGTAGSGWNGFGDQ